MLYFIHYSLEILYCSERRETREQPHSSEGPITQPFFFKYWGKGWVESMFSADKVFTARLDSALLLGHSFLTSPHTLAMNCALYHAPYARVDTVKNGCFCSGAGALNSFLAVCSNVDMFICSFSLFGLEVRVRSKCPPCFYLCISPLCLISLLLRLLCTVNS